MPDKIFFFSYLLTSMQVIEMTHPTKHCFSNRKKDAEYAATIG